MNGARRITLAALIGMFLVGVQAASAGDLPTLVREIPAPVGAEFFGSDLAALGGDVDGDNVPDFLVGCEGFWWGTPFSGFVVSGASGQAIAEVSLGWGFFHVAGVGDLTGDGIPDWAATWATSGPELEMTVSVFSGTARGPLGYDDVLYERRLGASLSVAGGNGRVVLGAAGGFDGNQAFFLVGPAGELRAHLTGEAGSGFASSVENVGDWNGDGIEEYALGAPRAANRVGRIYVVSGAIATSGPTDIRALPPTGLLVTIDGPQPGDQIGGTGLHPALANVGDLTGDGTPDVAVAAPFATTNTLTENGSVLVYDIGRDGQGTFSATLLYRRDGDQDGQRFGLAVASAGDLNSDHVPDVAVSTGWGWPVCFFDGRSFAALGCLPGPGFFGSSLARTGDLEPDTRVNLAIGAPAVSHNSSLGSVFVYNAGWITREADFDFDNDVDLGDFLVFQQCFTGSNNAYGRRCRICDLDNDGDVDLSDFTIFQLRFTGSL